MYEVSRSAVLLEGEKSTAFSLEQGVAQGCSLSPIFNPRRACAARVTVVVVFVCHSVCYARTHFSSYRSRQKQGHIPSGGRRSEYVGFSLKLLCSKVMA